MTSAIMNKSAGNVTNETLISGRNEALAKVEIGVLATVLYMALFGNGVVLLVLRLRRQKLTRMQWFIAHLAIADLFVGFFNILPQLIWDITVQFYGNDVLCRFITYFQVVAMYATSYVLVMTAIDRYVSICHPLTSQTLSPKRVHLMIAMAWSISLVCSLPQIFVFRYVESETQCLGVFEPVWGLKAYALYICLTDYVIPFFILAFCYGKICHMVWASAGLKESAYRNVCNHDNGNKTFRMRISFRSARDPSLTSRLPTSGRNRSTLTATYGCTSTESSSKKPRGHQRTVSRSKVKTIKLTLTVVLCYLLCWAPFFVTQLLEMFGRNVDYEDPVVVILVLLASLNSCTNPWIYLAFSWRPCSRNNRANSTRSWLHASTHVTTGGGDPSEVRSSRMRASMRDFGSPTCGGGSSRDVLTRCGGSGSSKC